jgi:hypothetical protein
VTYGAHVGKDLMAYCSQCGTYLKDYQTHTDHRGALRHVDCGQLVRRKPQPSRVRLRIQRKQGVKKV